MKRIEMNQMELVIGGNNPFWHGVGCGLVIVGGVALGALAGASVSGGALTIPGAIAGGAVGVGTCLLSS